MDMTEFMEGDYITKALVENSKTQKGVILNSGEVKEYDGRKGIVILVSMDKKQKDWRLNRTTLKNFSDAWGTETKVWTEKIFGISIKLVNGKESIVGIPIKK